MRFDPPLVSGTLIKRYKRFLADVELEDGRVVTAHCPNSGSMLDVAVPGRPVALTPHDDPKRKLQWTWELIQLGRHWVGVNTGRPNTLVAEAIEAQRIPELAGYGELKREQKYGTNSRIDILLRGGLPGEGGRPDCYVEVKNVTLARDGVAEFPDAVTARGAKHMRELAQVVAEGQRGVLVFWVYRSDIQVVRPADRIDPEYGVALREAAAAGVEILAWDAKVGTKQVQARGPVPVDLG